jgi:hypothetical protein
MEKRCIATTKIPGALVYNHYVILNKSETQSHTTNPTVLKLELTVIIKSSSLDDVKLKKLLDTGCTKDLIKVNCLPAEYFEMNQNQTRYLVQQIQRISSQNYDIPLTFSFIEFDPSREIEWLVAIDKTDSQSCYDMIIRQFLQ